jgi:ABC-type protease/lipase transport system fused ATPase/permease subunit
MILMVMIIIPITIIIIITIITIVIITISISILMLMEIHVSQDVSSTKSCAQANYASLVQADALQQEAYTTLRTNAVGCGPRTTGEWPGISRYKMGQNGRSHQSNCNNINYDITRLLLALAGQTLYIALFSSLRT